MITWIGAALGGHRDNIEDLEGADHRHNEHQGQDRAQQGHRDPPEHGPLAGAVDLSRLVDGVGDRLEADEDVPVHLYIQAGTESIDHRGPHSVQPTGGVVVAGTEFPAGMQLGVDDLHAG